MKELLYKHRHRCITDVGTQSILVTRMDGGKGGKLNVTNNGVIQKRVSGGNVNIDTGGLMDMNFGSIQ